MCITPRIYVADLAAYVAGYHHGCWIDATKSLDDIQEKIQDMLSDSPIDNAEEFAIHDYEDFDGYTLGEYASLKSVHNAATFITEYPDFGAALLAYFSDIEEAKRTAEDCYCGHYDAISDFAAEITEQTSDISEHLAPYIDFEKMARDMEMGGDILNIEGTHGGVHIFWNR